MLSNTDITISESQTEANELQAEAEAGAFAENKPSAGRRIASAALILMAGTILSRFLGVGRESTIAFLFGADAPTDAFTIANHVATIVFDLLISGTVSAALVPVFSEYAQRTEDRAEFGRVVSTIITLAGIFLVLSVGILEIFAQPLVNFMGIGYPPEVQELAFVMTQWVLPGVFFMGISGVIMAALYSLHRFVYPAFTSVLFNIAIIACAFTLSGLWGVKSLAVGLVIGAFAMVALQLPGLRDIPIRPRLELSHPAVRKILKLYAPVGLSVIVSSIALVIDRSLASQVGQGAISAMRYATTLVQFGLGIVSAAISLASLPTLSQFFTNGDEGGFKRTLSGGLRLVTVLVLPAAALLLALSIPLVSFIFKHGEFGETDQNLTVLALRFYVIGLPFAAVDQVLLFAFYARKNTITPAMIGIAQFAVYLTIAYGTYGTWGMPGLVLASSAQLAFHAVVTAVFLLRAMREAGGLRGYGIGTTALKAGGASVALAIISFGVWWLLTEVAGIKDSNIVTEAILLGIPALVGFALYAVLVWQMRLPEVELVAGKIVGRLRRKR
ncbi:MAG: murein biosynthesis integral membrane protein MurJ [Chloroflexia bacterium]